MNRRSAKLLLILTLICSMALPSGVFADAAEAYNEAVIAASETAKDSVSVVESVMSNVEVAVSDETALPESFATLNETLFTSVGNMASINTATQPSGTKLSDDCTVSARFSSTQSGVQLIATASYTESSGFSIGATKQGIYDVVVTARVNSDLTLTKFIKLIVVDSNGQLPSGMFSVDKTQLEAVAYDTETTIGTINVIPSDTVTGSNLTYSVDWNSNTTDLGISVSSNGRSADIKVKSGARAGSYGITATINCKGFYQTFLIPVTITKTEARISGVHDTYTIPNSYSEYVISAPVLSVKNASGEWKDYSGKVTWTLTAQSSDAGQAFSTYSIDANTGYTRFVMSGSRKYGTYRFVISATADDGRTATQTFDMVVVNGDGIIPTPAPTRDPSTPRIGIVNADRVYVRSGANTSASYIGMASKGDRFTVTDWSQEWYKIEYFGNTGYIYGRYIAFEDETPATAAPTAVVTVSPTQATTTATPAPTTTVVRYGRIVVTNSTLRLRDKPASNSTILTSMPNGAIIQILDTQGDWYHVKYNQYTGYASRDYIVITEGQPTATAGATPTAATTAQAYQQGTVTLSNPSSTLLVRSAPNGTIVGRLANGASVRVYETSGDYYRIQSGSISGYSAKQYITIGGTTPTTAPTAKATATASPTSTASTTTKGTVVLSNANSKLNVRASANSSARVLGQVSSGETVTILGTSGDYYRIKYGSSEGYVMKSYVRIGSVPTTAPTATAKPTATASANSATVVKDGGLKLYETEGGAVLRTIPNYGVVTVIRSFGTLTRVTYNGTTGYVESKYLKSGIVKEPSTGKTAKVSLSSSSYLNLRESGSDSARILTTIPNGATVEILSNGSTWTRVRYNSYSGYCMTKYLK